MPIAVVPTLSSSIAGMTTETRLGTGKRLGGSLEGRLIAGPAPACTVEHRCGLIAVAARTQVEQRRVVGLGCHDRNRHG